MIRPETPLLVALCVACLSESTQLQPHDSHVEPPAQPPWSPAAIAENCFMAEHLSQAFRFLDGEPENVAELRAVLADEGLNPDSGYEEAWFAEENDTVIPCTAPWGCAGSISVFRKVDGVWTLEFAGVQYCREIVPPE